MCKKMPYLVCFVLMLGLVQPSLGQGWNPNTDPSLIGWWTFDETSGTTASDSSGQGNHGTLQGNPQWVAGRVDGALEFDGVDDYVEVPHATSLTVDSEVTVAAWINAERHTGPGGADWQGILAKSNDPRSYSFYTEVSGALHFSTAGVGTLSAGQVPLNEWVHVAAMVVGGMHQYYINGEPAGTGGSGITLPGTSDTDTVMIGRTHEGSREFLGMIDDVRIYNRALSQAEIKELIPPQLKAHKPNPPDGTIGVVTPLLQWKAGDTAAQHDVYLGTDPDALEFMARYGRLQTVYYHQAGLTPGTTYYWRINEIEADGTTVHIGDVWSFFVTPLKPWDPRPADGATDVLPDASLSWQPGKNALMYQVYVGDNFDDVDNGTGDTDKGIMTETTYAPEGIRPETIVYWRIDTFDGLVWQKGDIWSYTTVAGGTGRIIREWWSGIGAGTAIGDLTGNPNYPDNPTGWEFVDLFEGPVDWADNYGSRLRGWLFPPVTGDYIFWLATDDQGQLWLSTDEDPANTEMIANVPGWVPSRDFDNTGGGSGGPEQKSAAISLEQGKVYYIEAMMKEGGGGDNIAVAWQGPIGVRQVITADYVGATPFLPVKAYSPSPGNGATDVTDAPTLTWLAGERAAQHDVFFGTDRDAVANADTTTAGIYRGRQALAATSYIPTELPLAWDTTYFWRMDELNTADPESPWKGNVWSFTTANFIIVEDFEEYDDFCNRIFYKWKDGWGYSADPDCGVAASGGNGTGSTVGNLAAPYAEQTIVHGGNQSMPYEYNNTGTGGKARYSEASREFATPQNWARNNVKALTLWFRGEPGNTPETLYVAVEDSAGQLRVANHPNPEALQIAGWRQWNIPLTQFSGVNLASVKKLYIGVGNRSNPQMGGTGKLYFDDIRVYPARCVPSLAKPAVDLSNNCIVDYADVEIISDQWLNSGFMITPTDPGNSGLIAYYPLNGNANDTVGGHNGTTTGIVSYGTGKIGQAIQLDGVDDYVDCGTDPVFNIPTNITVACWIKVLELDKTWQAIVTKGDNSWRLHRSGTSNNIAWGTSGISPTDITGSVNVNDGQWHHVAGVYDGTQKRLYVDGNLDASSDSTGNIDTSDYSVYIGENAQATGRYWTGLIDEVRVYSRALSGAQVAWLAGRTSPFSIPADLHQDDVIDFKDLAVLGDSWLDEILWPQP